VRVSRDRIEHAAFAPSGIELLVAGTEGETIELTALQPAPPGPAGVEWVVLVKRITFQGSSGRMQVAFP
jgi:hypothetical protein